MSRRRANPINAHDGTAFNVPALSGAPMPKDGELKRTKIPDNFKGIKIEVNRMKEYAIEYSRDALVRRTAEHILLACGTGSRMSDDATRKDCAIINTFQWAKENFQFVNDPVNAELLKTPRRMIKDLQRPSAMIEFILGPNIAGAVRGEQNLSMDAHAFMKLNRAQGDCDDAAVFLASLLMSVGIRARFRMGGKKSTSGKECWWHHVWVQALSSRGWLDLDITRHESDIGWFFPGFECTEIVEIL